MKKIYSFILILIFTSFVVCSLYSQQAPPPNKADEELTKDEAIFRINEFQLSIQELTAKLSGLDADILRLKGELAQSNTSIKNCKDAYYALIGATDADIAKYRQQLGVIEGKIRQMQRLSDDELADKTDEIKALEEEINKMRMVKIAVLPEFYNKIISLARDAKGLYKEKKIKGYTVGTWAENRDCLWNIAGKNEIYGDPFQWPKIWQSNTDVIKNPDIIQPGWVLKVPPTGPKTQDEMKAERKYWRNKRAAMEKNTEETPKKGE
jgi:hypothetical protein